MEEVKEEGDEEEDGEPEGVGKDERREGNV